MVSRHDDDGDGVSAIIDAMSVCDGGVMSQSAVKSQSVNSQSYSGTRKMRQGKVRQISLARQQMSGRCSRLPTRDLMHVCDWAFVTSAFQK